VHLTPADTDKLLLAVAGMVARDRLARGVRPNYPESVALLSTWVARKGGPGIERADLLVVNKTDLAPYVGVDVDQMSADALAARGGRPVVALSRHDPASITLLLGWVRSQVARHQAGELVPLDPGPMAPHFHAGEERHGHDDHALAR
jgi:urease gamma subunit